VKFRLNRKQSLIFTSIYVLITLGGRFYLEEFLQGYYLISIGIGLYFVLLYWALWKKKFINFDDENTTEESGNA
jgi:hypothetical protein